MQTEIVPFQRIRDHYEKGVALENLIYPDYKGTPESWERSDKHREEKYFHQRYWLRDCEADRFIGFGACGHTFWAHHPDRYYLDIWIHPDFQLQGYGKQLYQFLLEILEPRNPATIEAEAREGSVGVRFLEDRDYTLKTTEYTSKLDLAEFDATQFDGLMSKIDTLGLRFRSLTELRKSDPNFLRKYYEATKEIHSDVPWHNESTPTPFDLWVKRFEEYPNRLEEAYITALDSEDNYVGVTMLMKNGVDQDTLYTGLTGVTRPYRRKGIATALKVASLSWAKENIEASTGRPPVVLTENEENNPMYELNQKLGFVKQPSFFFYQKKLRDEA